jgi:hypothetical protein
MNCIRIPDEHLLFDSVSFEEINKILRISFLQELIIVDWNDKLWIDIDGKKANFNPSIEYKDGSSSRILSSDSTTSTDSTSNPGTNEYKIFNSADKKQIIV